MPRTVPINSAASLNLTNDGFGTTNIVSASTLALGDVLMPGTSTSPSGPLFLKTLSEIDHTGGEQWTRRRRGPFPLRVKPRRGRQHYPHLRQ